MSMSPVILIISGIIFLAVVAVIIFAIIKSHHKKQAHTNHVKDSDNHYTNNTFYDFNLNQNVSENIQNESHHKLSDIQNHHVSGLHDDFKHQSDSTHTHHHHNDSDSTYTSTDSGNDNGGGGGDSGGGGNND